MQISNKKITLSAKDKLNLKNKFKNYVLNELSNSEIIISKDKEAKIYELSEKLQNLEIISELCPNYYDYMTNKEIKKQLIDNFDAYLEDLDVEKQLELTNNSIEIIPFIIIGIDGGFYQLDFNSIILNF